MCRPEREDRSGRQELLAGQRPLPGEFVRNRIAEDDRIEDPFVDGNARAAKRLPLRNSSNRADARANQAGKAKADSVRFFSTAEELPIIIR